MSALQHRPDGGSVLRVAVIRFAVLTAATLLSVGTVTALVSQHIARDEAVRDARVRTIGITEGIAAPLVDSRVRAGDPQAVRRLGTALRNRMGDGTVSHIVVWDLGGSILWADEQDLVGRVDDLPDELATLAPGDSLVEEVPGHPLGDSQAAEDLVEVYVRSIDADGHPFVLEAYTPRDRIQTDTSALLGELLALTAGSLLVLALAILPLALSLARRIDRANAARQVMLHHSIRSWQRERERLAQSLHDDVIQDLSAMGYALPALLDALPRDAAGSSARETGEQVSRALTRSVTSLRAALADLAPATYAGAGLAPSLEALTHHPSMRGLSVDLHVAAGLRADEQAGALVYRIVREGLHNVVKHAHTAEATVRVTQQDDRIEVVVEDDGPGPGPDALGEGHVGLRLLSRTCADVGGELALTRRREGGARLHAVVPTSLVELDPPRQRGRAAPHRLTPT
jgi:signal transduction histidine kinase